MSYLMNKSEDPEFVVYSGSSLIFEQNKVFITENCNAILFGDSSYKLISKNDYLIGVVSFDALRNIFLFFPSKTACKLSIVNLIEICLVDLIKNKNTNKFYFITKNPVADVLLQSYFSSNITNAAISISDLKEEKLNILLKRYDQITWI